MKITKRKLRRMIQEALALTSEVQLIFDEAGITPDEGIEVQNARAGTGPEWMGTSSYEKLFDYYAFKTREMPPEIASAEGGDPDYWILDELEELGLGV